MASAEDLTIEEVFILDVLRSLVNEDLFTISYSKDKFSCLNWRYLIKISTQQKVLGFMAHAAHKQGWISFLSANIRLVLENALLEYRFLNEEKKMHFRRISVLLEKRDIPVFPLKGIYLSSFVYKDMPYRSMDDIDVFISKEHADKAVTILEEDGFALVTYPLRYRWHTQIIQEIFPKEDFYWKRLGRNSYSDGEINIDIHWEPYYVIEGQPIIFDTDFLKQCQSSPLHHLLLLSAHTSDQYTPSLVQLFDMACSIHQIPEVLFRLEEEMKSWPLPVRKNLLRLVNSVEDIFFRNISISELSDQAKDLLQDFFRINGKKERYDPYAPALSVLQKIKFRLGYLIPEPSYYQENNSWRRYQRHWSFIIGRFNSKVQ